MTFQAKNPSKNLKATVLDPLPKNISIINTKKCTQQLLYPRLQATSNKSFFGQPKHTSMYPKSDFIIMYSKKSGPDFFYLFNNLTYRELTIYANCN